MYRKLILLLVCMIPCIEAHAQTFFKEDAVRCSIFFPQSSSGFDPEYKENAVRLTRFVDKIYLREGDPSMAIKKIIVSSGASPEGSKSFNDRLSRARAEAILEYLRENTSLSDTSIIVQSPGVDWESLAVLVEESADMPDRDSVLAIIRSDKYGDDDIARRKSLEDFNGGVAYQWMYEFLFPYLRHSSVRIAYINSYGVRTASLPDPTPKSSLIPTDIAVYQALSDPPAKKEIFYLRTNLLAPISNFGLEVCLGNNWSIGADYYYPWIFRNPNHKNCFQLLGGSIEGRYWFGSNRREQDRLEGHSLGLGIMGGYYDMERNYTGDQGEFAAISIDYLYALPIFKDRMHMEFSLGLGYIYSYVKPYNVFEDGGKAYKTGYTERFHWAGPVKATVSFVVPIKAKRRAGR